MKLFPKKGTKTPQTQMISAQTGTGSGTKGAQEKRRTLRLEKTLPARIELGEWPEGRKKRFFLRHGKERKLVSFEAESTRNDYAEKLARGVQTEGSRILEVDTSELTAIKEFLEETGTNLSELRELHRLYARQTKMIVLEAVEAYHKLRAHEGLDADSIRHTRKILSRFAEEFGSTPLVQIGPAHIRQWLENLKKRHGFHPQTLRHHRKDVAVLFSVAVREDWVRKNPCDAVVPPKIPAVEKPILGLKDAITLFREAQGSPIAGKLALEAFAGLRVSSAARIKFEEIDFEHKGLTLPAAKHKLEKRFYVGPFPENLFAWLKLPGQWWDISESYYDKLKGQVFTAAHVKNPGNVLRHSFCTYHIAAHLDASKTATLLTHQSATMLYQHYRGKGVTQAEGLAYFQILPT